MLLFLGSKFAWTSFVFLKGFEYFLTPLANKLYLWPINNQLEVLRRILKL